MSNNRYRGGVVTYLEVITAQNIAPADERSAVDILRRRVTATVQLIKAIEGGISQSCPQCRRASKRHLLSLPCQPARPEIRDGTDGGNE